MIDSSVGWATGLEIVVEANSPINWGGDCGGSVTWGTYKRGLDKDEAVMTEAIGCGSVDRRVLRNTGVVHATHYDARTCRLIEGDEGEEVDQVMVFGARAGKTVALIVAVVWLVMTDGEPLEIPIPYGKFPWPAAFVAASPGTVFR